MIFIPIYPVKISCTCWWWVLQAVLFPLQCIHYLLVQLSGVSYFGSRFITANDVSDDEIYHEYNEIWKSLHQKSSLSGGERMLNSQASSRISNVSSSIAALWIINAVSPMGVLQKLLFSQKFPLPRKNLFVTTKPLCSSICRIPQRWRLWGRRRRKYIDMVVGYWIDVGDPCMMYFRYREVVVA